MRIYISLITICFGINLSLGQTTIVSDGFNGSSSLFSTSFNTATTAGFSNLSTTGADFPASTAYAVEGTHAIRVLADNSANDKTAILTSSSSINTASYSSVQMSLRVMAVSRTSTSDGPGSSDYIQVEVSPDGGVNYYNTVRVTGSGSAGCHWSYTSGTGNASTAYDGNTTPTVFTPAGTGNRTTDGYSTISITNLPSVSTLRFRITVLIDDPTSDTPLWCIDDFRVTGLLLANAGTDQSVCTNSVTLAGNNPISCGGTGAWSVITGSGTFANSNQYNTLVTNLVSGTNTFRWTFSGGCGSSFDDVDIINSALSFTGFPLSDTVYNEQGNASFGVSTNVSVGVTYQWQISTNGGSSWSNLSNSALYSGVTTTVLQVTNPIYAMNGYLYRCVATYGCGSVNSSSATLVVIPQSVFSNSSTHTCGSWGTNSTSTECLDVSIPVTGIGTLNTISNVLKQINISLGSASCVRDLSTYDFSLIAPDGTVYNFITNLTTTTTPMWIDIKFRDHSSLERVRDYDVTVQQDYFPYSIGYYAVDADNSFIPTFNGKNADGTWIFRICEQDNDASNISVQSVQLLFGSKTQINDITSSNANNFCSGAVCVGADGTIIVGTNNGYSGSDPLYPGNSPTAMHPDGSTFTCEYNGANNNSAWFYFIASSTTAYFTVSGITNTAPGNIDTQPIVFSMSSDCSGSYTIPPGGCPDDDDDSGDHYYVNNMEYADYSTAGGTFQNGGGVESDGNIYADGIAANSEFTLSGLSVGQKYYLYIDGNGGISSTFYIEGQFGCETCSTPLPVELTTFDVSLLDKTTHITWQTASERNNDYFIVERSYDGIEWEFLEKVKGAGSSTELLSYISYDYHPYRGVGYYRLKQADYDGKSSYSEIRSVYNTDDLMILPNPSTGIFGVGGMPKHQENTIVVMDITGKVLEQHSTEEESYQLDLTQRSAGVYLVIINGTESIKVIKE
jgi:hypothetical protein